MNSKYKPLCKENRTGFGALRVTSPEIATLLYNKISAKCLISTITSYSFLVRYFQVYFVLWNNKFFNSKKVIIPLPLLPFLQNVIFNSFIDPYSIIYTDIVKMIMPITKTLPNSITINRNDFDKNFEEVNRFLYDARYTISNKEKINDHDFLDLKKQWFKLGLAPLPEPEIWDPKLYFMYSSQTQQVIYQFLLCAKRSRFCKDLIPLVLHHIIDLNNNIVH